MEWPAIESNPDVMNQYASQLGLNIQKYQFIDVFSLDQDMLNFVPQPVVAMILLFPSSCKVTQTDLMKGDVESVFLMEQTKKLNDACGTIAMIHAMANNLEVLEFDESSVLSQYVALTRDVDASQRGQALSDNTAIAGLHETFSNQGDTQRVDVGKSGHHFVCFTGINERLYELDGLKKVPTDHGEISNGFLNTVAEKIKEVYLAPHPDVYDFSMIAISQIEE